MSRISNRAAEQTASVARDALAHVRATAATVAARRRKRTGNARRVEHVDHRPDGSPISASPHPTRARTAWEPWQEIIAPFNRFGAALRDRWQDAVREGKLAAREKELEVRADYERRVRHDARLHVRQREYDED